MINVSTLMRDPAFAARYTVVRTKGVWVRGRFVEDPPERLKFYGPVQPATEKELEHRAEGDRCKGVMKFFCKPPNKLYITRETFGESDETRVSDKIEFRGDVYEITEVKDWSANGYVRAFGHRIGVVGNG